MAVGWTVAATSHLSPVAAATMEPASVKPTAMETRERMASSEMSRTEIMPKEVVSPIVRTEATEIRTTNGTKKSVASAAAEQKDCGCGN
jgi:hypothetical protein